MKKKLALLVTVLLVGLGVVAISRILLAKDSPTQALGTKQIVKNEGEEAKTVTIKKAGYYDITTLKANDAEKARSQIPELGRTRLGQYVDEGESISLYAGEVATYQPAKFEKIAEKKGAYVLSEIGNYLIGEQFPGGDYTVSIDGAFSEWTDKSGNIMAGQVQLVVYTPDNIKESKSFKLTEDKPSLKIKVKNQQFLAVKTTDPGLSVVLKPVK